MTPLFLKATPLWARELQGVLNAGLLLTATLSPPAGEPLLLRLAAMSHYRVWLNGRFVAVGPARAAQGHARVDELDLAPHLQPGPNALRIEVVAFHAWTYSHVADPGFVQAEVVAGTTPLAWTAVGGGHMLLTTWPGRHTKLSRYSFQRAFTESYPLPGAPTPLTPVARSPRKLRPRRAPLPTFEITDAALLATGTAAPNPAAEVKPHFWEPLKPDVYKQYPRPDWDADPSGDLERLTHTLDPTPQTGPVSPTRFALYELPRNLSGMVQLRLRAGPQGCRVVVTWDELLAAGKVDLRRMGCVNCIAWTLPPGEHTVESFEPYTAKFLQVQCLEGDCDLLSVSLRRYENPAASLATFESSDPELNAIFDAGRSTFAQNAVDFYTDCPSRERAGWLGDSYFTARAERALTGTSAVEHAFLENFLLAGPDARLPDGMLPMCYPADHPNGNYLPQWGLWLILQLEEYLARTQDAALVAAFAPKVEKLLGWFERFERPDGLLTALPGWSFIEWSKANDFQRDLNYPTNFLYAGALRAAARLYPNPPRAAKADRILAAAAKESFDGQFFVDNAARTGDTYTPTRNRTEVCQYYAFYFGAATPQSHPDLWHTLVHDFGPDRAARCLHEDIHPANMIWGIMLRLELLRAAGHTDQVLRDLRGYLTPMVRQTGTLWEHNNPSASCNHAFASHACHLLQQEALAAHLSGTTLTLKPPPPSLQSCSGQIPTPHGPISIAWHRDGPAVKRTQTLPDGYTLCVQE